MEERYGVFTQRIARISRCIRRLKAEEMARFGLKGPHVSCLYYLGLDGPLTAPVTAGTVVGAAVLRLNGTEIGRVPLFVSRTVPPELSAAAKRLCDHGGRIAPLS